jgi:LVIVD repeat-containing protein
VRPAALTIVLGLFVAISAAPAAAAPQMSRGIQVAGSIPERGVVSARPVGNLLYVSSLTGVSIFDISSPRAPVRIGRLDLPNAQNEDVDVAGGILLVSDDPFGGRGILHVIDVRDPTQPRLLSTYSTWVRGLLDDFFNPPRRGGIGHTATCIQECRYAWLAGSAAGIDIIDLRDPANPRLARRFAAREAAGRFGTHDVQVDASGLAWVAGGRGTAAYDVSDPVRPRLVKRTDRRGARGPLNNFIHHNSLRLRPNVVAITEEDFGDQCRRAGTLQTWRIGRGRLLRPLDSFGVERDRSARVMCSAHYFDARDGLIAQGFYEQGIRLIDARRPGRLRQVGWYLDRPGLYWDARFAPTDPTGSTVYAINHTRGIDVLALDRAALRPVRRRGARRLLRNPKQGFAMIVDDGRESVRPGQRLTIGLGVAGRGGPVTAEVTLPPALTNVRPPRGVAFDPATRTLRFTVRRVRRIAVRVVRAQVRTDTPLGTQLETIAYARGPADPLPLDDRGVDKDLVTRRGERGRRATAARALAWPAPRAGAGARLFCALPRDYTF